jgi:DNA-binding response OmpR family regulator
MAAKILVVDDEQDMVELLTYTLKEKGYKVFTATSGLEALNKARKHLPDLILLDLMLDGIDGYSICEILRRQPSTATVPVIMITALAGQIVRLNGLASGADDFVSKPFSPADLIARVARLCEVHERRVESKNSEDNTNQQPRF